LAISAVTGLLLAWAVPAARHKIASMPPMRRWVATSLKTISLKASLEQFDPENRILYRPYQAGHWCVRPVQSRDLIHGSRTTNGFASAGQLGQADDTEIITPAAGYVIGYDATNGRLPKPLDQRDPARATMSGRRSPQTLRELERPMIVIE